MTVVFQRAAGVGGLSTTIDIGAAGNDRLVVVFLDDESSVAGFQATVTVDGKTCAQGVVANNPDGIGNHQEMHWIGESGLGASAGTVTVAASGGTTDTDWCLHILVFYGADTAAIHDSGVDQTSVAPTDITVPGIDVPAGGVAVFGAANGGNFRPDVTATSPMVAATDETDGTAGGQAWLATGYAIETTAQTGKSYVGDMAPGSSLRNTGIVAVWAPADPAPPVSAPISLPTPTGPWSVDLCNSWQRIGYVDAFDFAGIERFNEEGEWSLSCAHEAIEWGYRDVAGQPKRWRPRDVDAIRIVSGSEVSFAGYVLPISTGGAGGMERTIDGNGDRITWSGPDAWDVLERRLVWPTPAETPPWPDSHDVRTGIASTVLAGFLQDNLGKTARAFRPIDGIVIADHGVGEVGTWSARLQTLAALAQRICAEGEIRCRVSLSFEGQIRIDIDQPADRSAEIVLTDQGDLSSIQIRRVPQSATFVIAGGQGEGADRMFATTGYGIGAARREVWSDQSSLTDVSELAASAGATLAAGDATWSVAAEVSDESSEMIAAVLGGARVGDLIGLRIDGEAYTVPVSAKRWTINPDRQVVTPILGTAAPDELAALQSDVAGLAGRLDTQIT